MGAMSTTRGGVMHAGSTCHARPALKAARALKRAAKARVGIGRRRSGGDASIAAPRLNVGNRRAKLAGRARRAGVGVKIKRAEKLLGAKPAIAGLGVCASQGGIP